MRILKLDSRIERLIDEAVARFGLDLSGITVLTETASGPFVLTSLIAASAGGSVIAVTRDSRFASGEDVRAHTQNCATRLGVADAVEVHVGRALERAGDADLITNLGFVRPIDERFVARMRPGAAVSLMCETWEVRPEDADVAACRAAGVPVLGTNERDRRLQTFRFVGMLALKLLLELEIEVVLSRLVVVSSEPFASPIVETLQAAGAEVRLLNTEDGADLRNPSLVKEYRQVDAVVVAEHRDRRAVVGGETGIPVEFLEAADARLVHITGAVHDPGGRLRKNPPGDVVPGRMTVTTDVLGPRPVVDLHTAGLRVGQALVEAMRRMGDASDAETAALEVSPGLATGVVRV
jgi:hypothetical protein